MAEIDALFASVSIVSVIERNVMLGRASSFFFEHNDALYLITNRHVVVDQEHSHVFDALDLRIHTDPRDLSKNLNLRVPLFDSSGQKRWLESQRYPTADVVAVKLDGVLDRQAHLVNALTFQNLLPDDLHVVPGHEVMVMGYPHGFHDETHNLPIIRDAAVSSAFGVHFKGEPCFIIDAHLHPGTSGSPVLTKPQATWLDRFGSIRSGPFPPYLLGIHSASWLFPDAKDQSSGLNIVWYASILREIVQ